MGGGVKVVWSKIPFSGRKDASHFQRFLGRMIYGRHPLMQIKNQGRKNVTCQLITEWKPENGTEWHAIHIL